MTKWDETPTKKYRQKYLKKMDVQNGTKPPKRREPNEFGWSYFYGKHNAFPFEI